MYVVNIEWDTGEMKIDLEQFFPTTLLRTTKLFKIMAMDYKHDFSYVRDWIVNKIDHYKSEVEKISFELCEHRKEFFEDGYWYGDCVRNENKAKQLEKLIITNRKSVTDYQKYLLMFDKYVVV